MTQRHINNFEESLKHFPGIAAGGDDVFLRRGKWAEHFRGRIGSAFAGRVILEVGCADASFLAAVAAKHPGTGFIGLDWKFKTLHSGAERIAAAGLGNVALLRGRAQDLLKIFAAGELDEVWVFHPEPCAEPPQAKNRLIAEPFLREMHEVLRDSTSTLSIKTDHAGYYQWILGLLGECEPDTFHERARKRDLLPPGDVPPANEHVRDRFVMSAHSPDFWQDKAVLAHTAGRCFAGEMTSYEARFLKKRRPIYYVELQRSDSKEPRTT